MPPPSCPPYDALARLPAGPLARARLLALGLALLAALLAVVDWAAGRPSSWLAVLAVAAGVDWLGWRWVRWHVGGVRPARADLAGATGAALAVALAAGPSALPVLIGAAACAGVALGIRGALAAGGALAGVHAAAAAAHGDLAGALAALPLLVALAGALGLLAQTLRAHEAASAREGILRLAVTALLGTGDAERVRAIAEETALDLAGRPPGGRARLLEGSAALTSPRDSHGFVLLPVPSPGPPCALALEAPAPLEAGVRQALGGLAAAVAFARSGLAARRRRAAHLCRALVGGSGDPVLVVERGGRVLFHSRALDVLVGAPETPPGERRGGLLATPAGEGRAGALDELVHPRDAADLTGLVDALERGEAPAQQSWRLRRADGTWAPVMVTASSLLEHPDIDAIVLACRPVPAASAAPVGS